LTQTIPAAGAVRAVASGSPSEEGAFGAECVAAVEDVAPEGALVFAPVELAGAEAADDDDAGSDFVFFEDVDEEPAPTPGAPATAGSTFCAVPTIRCGRAFSSEEAATPLRERSSSDL
jgi:hypothetical protein